MSRSSRIAKCSLPLLAFSWGTASAQSVAAAKTDTSASFYLNYDVPESPAFAALGETPSQVLRGTASKPLVVSLLTSLAEGTSLPSGIGFDVAPYAYIGRVRSVSEYQRSPAKRLAANSLVSFAASREKQDTNSVRAAVGIRFTLHDDHDLLQDSVLQKEIAELLVPKKIECPKIGETNVCQKGTSTTELPLDASSAYDAARARLGAKRGWAAAIGVASSGRLGGGIPRSDSLAQRTGLGWGSVTAYMGGGHEVLGTAQWFHDTSGVDHMRAGAAYRFQTPSSALAAELAFDSKGGGILPGLSAEMRLLTRATLVIALLKDAPSSSTSPARLRFRTSLRWAATEDY